MVPCRIVSNIRIKMEVQKVVHFSIWSRPGPFKLDFNIEYISGFLVGMLIN